MDEGASRPWARARHHPLSSGWVYPISRNEIARALHAVSGRIEELVFLEAVGLRPGPRVARNPVLEVEWQPHDEPTGTWVRGVHMWVRGVPVTRRRTAHDRLVADGLPIAARWAADAPRQSEVWRDTRHELRFHLVDDRLTSEELEGGHWSTMKRV